MASAQVVSAQDYSIKGVIGELTFNKDVTTIDTEKKIGYSKSISEPMDDGTYWIKLETFTTGNAKIEMQAAPADIVLVLDLSTSMRETRGTQRTIADANDRALTYNKVAGARTAETNYTYDGYQVFAEEINGRYYLYYNSGGSDTKNYFRTNGNTTTNINNAASATSANGVIYTFGANSALRQGSTRIFELKAATEAFITAINDNDVENGVDGVRLGDRIAIITFEDNPTVEQELTYLDEDTVEELIKKVWNFTLSRGTQPGKAFVRANKQFAANEREGKVVGKDYTRTVLFYTDGEPMDQDATYGGVGPDGDTPQGGTKINVPKYIAVQRAYWTKNTYQATVWSVGVFTNTIPDGTETFLQYVSSNYPKAHLSDTTSRSEAINNMLPGDGPNTTGYYFNASNLDLTKLFQEIAAQSGGSSNTSLSQATSNVDIVTSSFEINNHDTDHPHGVCVFTAKCTGEENGKLTWATEIQIDHSNDTYDKCDEDGNVIERGVDVDDAIRVSTTGNVVDVTGFDYSNNWCGYVEDLQGNKKYQGHKIIIMIPVKMSEDAVGGPNVATNTDKSGIYLPGQDPQTDASVIAFPVPEVSLPLNIWIQKNGLQKGESAKFIIQRTTTPNNADSWVDVTSVFVTRPGVNSSTDDENPVVKLMGLPATDSSNAPFTYRVVEDAWDWSYSLESITDDNGTSIREGTERFAYTYKLQNNPFIFTNVKKSGDNLKVIRYAESKVTNTFNSATTTKVYNDSKENTGKGRTEE